jgi:hypothetical protein
MSSCLTQQINVRKRKSGTTEWIYFIFLNNEKDYSRVGHKVTVSQYHTLHDMQERNVPCMSIDILITGKIWKILLGVPCSVQSNSNVFP